MPIKTILAYLPSPTVARTVLSAATKVADPHGVHIIGLHLEPDMMNHEENDLAMSEEVREQLTKTSKAATAAVKKVFEESLGTAAPSHEWRSYTVSYRTGEDIIVAAAGSADLVICGLNDGDDTSPWANLTEPVLLRGGRPVLVIPSPLPVARIGDQVIIAWNGTREAVRAVFGSLDLLRNTSTVRVITYIENENQRPQAELSSSNIVAALLRHGIPAIGDVCYALGGDAAGALLSSLINEGCDLLVMGGYSHSRRSEMIFGGVSREILSKAVVPTLLSH